MTMKSAVIITVAMMPRPVGLDEKSFDHQQWFSIRKFKILSQEMDSTGISITKWNQTDWATADPRQHLWDMLVPV